MRFYVEETTHGMAKVCNAYCSHSSQGLNIVDNHQLSKVSDRLIDGFLVFLEQYALENTVWIDSPQPKRSVETATMSLEGVTDFVDGSCVPSPKTREKTRGCNPSQTRRHLLKPADKDSFTLFLSVFHFHNE
jgi:hypothetical protein